MCDSIPTYTTLYGMGERVHGTFCLRGFVHWIDDILLVLTNIATEVNEDCHYNLVC